MSCMGGPKTEVSRSVNLTHSIDIECQVFFLHFEFYFLWITPAPVISVNDLVSWRRDVYLKGCLPKGMSA